MKILALDTCSSIGSLAVVENNRLLFESTWNSQDQKHSERTTALIEELQEELPSLTHLALTCGPGSFTGVRIGLNVIRAMAYSFDLPVFTFCFLEMMAAPFFQKKKVLSLLNAQKNQVFAALYGFQPQKKIMKPAVVFLEELPFEEEVFFVGRELEGFSLPLQFKKLKEEQSVAFTMTQKAKSSMSVSYKEVVPHYIRASSAEENLLK